MTAFFTLPQRQGDKPETHFAVPHHQISQLASQEFRNQFSKVVFEQFRLTISKHPSDISVENAEGLWLNEDCMGSNREAFMQVPHSREFAHIHPDGSFHVNIPKELANEVIIKGWGEPHPKPTIHETLLYAPRDNYEAGKVMQVLRCSYQYARNIQVRSLLHPLGPRIFGDAERKAVTDVLLSGLMSRYTNWDGKVSSFERQVQEQYNVPYALMVSSGTASMAASLIALGIGPGDEVLVSAYTWIATASAVVVAGAVPVICDIDNFYGIDENDAQSKVSPFTKAIIVTHMRGVPCRIETLLAFAERNNLKFLEDACQCVGGKYKGRHVGTFGDAGSLSFNHFKNLCCGEGGLIMVKDKKVYERAWSAIEPGFQHPHMLKSVQDFPERRAAFSEWSTEHFALTTARAGELQGALATAQLALLPSMLAHTLHLKQYLQSLLTSSGQPKHYTFAPMEDPEGECGTSCTIVFGSTLTARLFHSSLLAEGVGACLLFHPNVPDCAVYYHWDSILAKQSPHPTGYPWKDPAYKGNVQYTQDMCPKALDLLSRSISFDILPPMSKDDMDSIARAVIFVDNKLTTFNLQA